MKPKLILMLMQLRFHFTGKSSNSGKIKFEKSTTKIGILKKVSKKEVKNKKDIKKKIESI